MFQPISFFCIAQRVRGPDCKRLYSPVIFPKRIDPPTSPNMVAWLDGALLPCEASKAEYVIYPQGWAPPSGFEVLQMFRWSPSSQVWEEGLRAAYASQQGQGRAPVLPSSGKPADKMTGKQGEIGAEEPERISVIQGQDGYYTTSSKTKKNTRATNFLLDILGIIHVVSEGIDEVEEVELRVTILAARQRREVMRLPYSEIKSVLAIVSERFGEAILYAQGKATLLGHFQEFFREKLAVSSHRYVIKTSGWNWLPGEKPVYVHDGAISPREDVTYQTGLTIPIRGGLTPAEALSQALKLFGLARNPSRIVVPVLYAHMGILWGLFQKAEHPPRTLLFIEGTTGSLKTAVAKLLFNFSGRPENDIPASFRDTSASLEVKMGQYRDRVLLVDDFCPANGLPKKTMEQTLEQLVRFYGDGIGRSRTNPQLKKTYEIKPRGLCAITGEDRSGGHSSLLRCLFLSVDRGTYDKELLARFQTDPRLWTSHLAYFIRWCEEHAQDIIALLSYEFTLKRKWAEGLLRERRLIDTCVSLALTAQVLIKYMSDVGTSDEEEKRRLYAVMETSIIQVCQESEQKSVEADPAKEFAHILLDALRREEARIGSVAEVEQSVGDFIGVEYDGFWYLWPDKSYHLILSATQRMNQQFPMSDRALWEALVNAGVLVPAAEKSKGSNRLTYGTRVSFLNRPRLLKIDPEGLRNLDA